MRLLRATLEGMAIRAERLQCRVFAYQCVWNQMVNFKRSVEKIVAHCTCPLLIFCDFEALQDRKLLSGHDPLYLHKHMVGKAIVNRNLKPQLAVSFHDQAYELFSGNHRLPSDN